MCFGVIKIYLLHYRRLNSYRTVGTRIVYVLVGVPPLDTKRWRKKQRYTDD